MLGYDHEAFWDQTPHTLALTVQAHERIKANQHNEAAWHTWHIAGLQRSQRLPPLRKLMVKPRHPQTDLDEQLEGLKRWVRATGGKIIYKQ